MKLRPGRTAAKAACVKVIMFVGLIAMFGQSSTLRAQYGPRCWTPPFFGNYYSLQLGGTNFVIRSITLPGRSFEHVSFAPIHLPIQP